MSGTFNTIYDLISSRPQLFRKLRKKYPGILEFSKKVKLIPWKNEYAVRDRNPEIVEKLRELDRALNRGLISQSEYEKESSKLLKDSRGIISRTEGVSFYDKNETAFRDEDPSDYVLIHELLHCYYKVDDQILNSAYLGLETLFWMGLNEERYQYGISEIHLMRYKNLCKKLFESPISLCREIEEKISRKCSTPKNIYAIMHHAGTLPDLSPEKLRLLLEGRYDELQPQGDECFRVLFSFFQNMMAALLYHDLFYTCYAKAIGIIA